MKSPIDDAYSPLSDSPPMEVFSRPCDHWLPWSMTPSPQAKYRRHVVKRLRKRSPDVCMKMWPGDPAIKRVSEVVSEAMCEYLNWPDQRFTPEDRFHAIYWDYLGDLGTVEARLKIEESFPCIPSTMFDELFAIALNANYTLGEFVNSISEILDRKDVSEGRRTTGV